MTMTFFIRASFLAALLLLAQHEHMCLASTSASFSYDPNSATGPAYWGDLAMEDNECNGKKNSPINIATSSCTQFADYQLTVSRLFYVSYVSRDGLYCIACSQCVSYLIYHTIHFVTRSEALARTATSSTSLPKTACKPIFLRMIVLIRMIVIVLPARPVLYRFREYTVRSKRSSSICTPRPSIHSTNTGLVPNFTLCTSRWILDIQIVMQSLA